MTERRLSIRAATHDDIVVVHGAILDLAEHLGARDHVESTPEDLLRYGFGEAKRFDIALAEIGDEFAGMCIHFPIYSTWMGYPGVYVQDLYVGDRHRGARVGEALLRHVARQSRDAGGGYLRLAVDVDNTRAMRFYERLGIGRSEYEQVHRITGEAFLAFCERETEGGR